ncbi:hypothetical protein LCGC14_2343400, partial [marine sediment metagenome]
DGRPVPKATETSVPTAMYRYAAVHFATHGTQVHEIYVDCTLLPAKAPPEPPDVRSATSQPDSGPAADPQPTVPRRALREKEKKFLAALGHATSVEVFRHIADKTDEELLAKGLKLSPVSQTLIEESVIGWKEFELEVMRDLRDNVVIICSIENIDAMGVHTGDSITVAPAQTLTDKEYQQMRDAAVDIIREIGVDTGGSNIQFALNPEDGRMVIIEMNPRVSRSSALASKATGFPIAKIAAKLAIGLTLDEIPNDITRETPASFEPTIDYVVTKIPRFTFEKFPEAEAVLTTQMKSVGEAMSIGRTFKESFQKALRSMENDSYGLEPYEDDPDRIRRRLSKPTPERIYLIADALRQGISVKEIYEITFIDPWFIENIKEIVEFEDRLAKPVASLGPETLREAKEMGFSDKVFSRTSWFSEISDILASPIQYLPSDIGI